MIIRIEEAPNIKNIKIDINFDDENNIVNISSTNPPSCTEIDTNTSHDQNSDTQDISLNIDETYDEETKEVVQKPTVPDPDRKIKVSEDMINAEF